jgi:hypothetical protein
MKKIWSCFALFVPLFFVPQVRAQNSAFAEGPVFAGGGPVLEAGLGSSYINMDIPGAGRVPLYGADATFSAEFAHCIGLKLDAGYARGFNVAGTGHSADVLNYLAGPVFYVARHRRYNLQIETLAGAARETGVNFTTTGQMVTGYTNKFAWAAGAALQYRLTPVLSMRLSADSFHTSFFNPAVAVNGQSNLRSTLSAIYTFGESRNH